MADELDDTLEGGEDTVSVVDDADDTIEGGDADDTIEGGADTLDAVSGADTATDDARAEANARIARLEADLLEAKSATVRKESTDAAKQREEMLASLEPNEKALYLAAEKTNNLEREVHALKLQVLDSSDKSSYLSKAANDPVYAKHQEEVEKTLEHMRKQNFFAPREEVLMYLIGRDALKGKSNKAGADKAKQAAGARVAATKAKPAVMNGDASGGRGAKSLEDRLANVFI